MGLMDVNEGAEYSEEELFGDEAEVNNMNEKCTAVLETSDDNGARANTDFRYDKNQIAAVLEQFAEGIRGGEIVIKENKPSPPVVTRQDALVQQNATVDNSEAVQNANIDAAAKRQLYRLKAEIFDVQVKPDTKSGKENVQWGLIPIDLDAPKEKYWQTTWVNCKDNNRYLKDNLSICGYPDATVDDLKRPDFVQKLIGIQVWIKVKPSCDKYWNTCIERRFYK